MSFNNNLVPLVKVGGATSITTILLIDVDVGSFSLYKYVPNPWAKHIKTTIKGAPNLGNPLCSKSDFSPPLAIVVVVASVLPSPAILSFMQQVESTPA